MNSNAIKRQLLAAIAMVLVAAIALGENIFQLIRNLNLELLPCERKLLPDRLQILLYMRICL